ncbi:MAG: DMT family transporter [Candidatus Brocadiia bacterium]
METRSGRWPRAAGYASVAAGALMWSTGGVFVKVLAGRYGADPRAIACLRSAFGGVVLAWALPRLRGGSPVRLGASAGCFTVVVAGFVLSTAGTTAANAVFLQYAYPLFVAVGAVVLLGERLGWRTVAALALGMAGVGTILVGSWEPGHRGGLAWGLGSSVAFAGFALLQRAMPRGSPVARSSLYNLAAGALLLPVAWGRLGLSAEALGVVALQGVFQLAIPYVLVIYGLTRIRATDAALITLIEPALNPVWVWLVVGEAASGSTVLGGALVLVALTVRFLGARRAPPTR